MKATEKLFEQDARLRVFDAIVLECREENGVFNTVLDRTAFFPEGGGQNGDRGTIGGSNVTDTHIKGNVIVHTLTSPVTVGQQVSCRVDDDFRMDQTQQHSGEHILSGIICSSFGYHNVGFHIGSDAVTIDFDGDLTDEQVEQVENETNAVIRKNVPLHIWFPEEAELASLPYRSKKALTGPVRIVEIPGADICACCGTHVLSTGEVGMVKVIDKMRYKGGVRLTILCGVRALRDYQARVCQMTRVSTLLSAKPLEIAEAVAHLKEEKDELRHEMQEIRENAFQAKLDKIPVGQETACLFEENLDGAGLARCASALAQRARLAVVFVRREDGWNYSVCSFSQDVRPFTQRLNGCFQGRGGGKSDMTSGHLNAGNKETLTAAVHAGCC